MEAIQDTVILRNLDHSARNRSGRSLTQPAPLPRSGHTPRSLSEDSARVPAEKSKASKSRTGKKGSMHADVIDRLDFSGVGPMFHHDGPFDACAPSRNRHLTKAPMAAWSNAPDGTPLTEREHRQPVVTTYMTEKLPRKNVDAIAEAWGIHEPEPFEDFSAGGGHGNDYRHHYSPSNTVSKRGSHDDSPIRRQTTRKTALPPPRPIFTPEADEEGISGPHSPSLSDSPGTGMKRSKSLLHRIRKMREMPNVPVNRDDIPADDYVTPPSPNGNTTARPTHRSQNSFLGRFGRGANGNGREYIGPSTTNEPYVYIDDPKDKELPKPPTSNGALPENGAHGYFDSSTRLQGGSPPGGGGLGRKRSLLKRVGKVVKGL